MRNDDLSIEKPNTILKPKPNYYNRVLMMDVDVNSPTFAKIPPLNSSSDTSVVVRKDLKPRHLLQVRTLIEYASQFAQKYNKFVRQGATVGNGRSVGEDDVVERWFNATAFKRFFNDTKRVEQAKNSEAWEGVECPV